VDSARSAYANNAFEFGLRDFATGGISPLHPWIFLQSDLGRRADSRWALLQIFSVFGDTVHVCTPIYSF